MPIELTTPVTEPAKTYNILWISNIQIVTDVGGPSNLRIDYTAARNVGTEEAPVYEGSGKVQSAYLGDLYREAMTRAESGDTGLAAALQTVLAAATKLAAENSIAEKLAGTYVAPEPAPQPAPQA